MILYIECRTRTVVNCGLDRVLAQTLAVLTKNANDKTASIRELQGALKREMEEKEHLTKLEARYAELLAEDPQLESRPTFLFFKGAANGLFAAGADELKKGVDDREALLIGIRCERGSHRFFRRYGERFEDSEGKQIFLEFAAEEREHLELLIREYRALAQRRSKDRPRPTKRRRRATA